MIDLQTIQIFLRKLQPAWSFVKITFIAYLMYSLLKRHLEEAVSPNYKKIQQTNKYILWYDELSDSYALEIDNSIIPLASKDEATKYI